MIKLKEYKGITLIALVITIIVLLLLAGISLSMLSGNNGILSQAQSAKKNTIEGSEKETISLAYTAAVIEKSVTGAKFEEELNKIVGENKTTVDEDEDGVLTIKFLDTNNSYKIDNDGSISKIEGKVNVASSTLMQSEYDSNYFFGNENVKRDKIESITIKSGENLSKKIYEVEKLASLSDEIKIAQSTILYTWDVSDEQDESIMAYATDEDADGLFEVIIASGNKIMANSNSSYLFYELKNLTTISGLDNLNTSNVTNMKGMFWGCGVTELDLSNFNTSNVTDMRLMFQDCRSLSSIDLKNFDTSNVTNMSSMFSGCRVTELDLSNFNTSNVTNMGYMFCSCINLESLNLNSFVTSNVSSMEYMFCNCQN